MDKIKIIADQLVTELGATSVFVYGSFAREENLKSSDCEIGVVFESDKYQKRSVLQEKYGDSHVGLFSFKEEELLNGTLDTPFQKSLYLRDLKSTARTIAGKDIVSLIPKPPITILDLIQETRFNLGYALAATHSFRHGDKKTAALHFSKSCLYGARSLIVLEKKEFLCGYKEILNSVSSMDLPEEYKGLVTAAYKARQEDNIEDSLPLFKNISFLNKFVEPKLLGRNLEETITI